MGMGNRTRWVFSSQSNSVGLPAASRGPLGSLRKLQHHLARAGRGKFHGENSVLVLQSVQLGGGVDDVVTIGKPRAIAAEHLTGERNADREP